MATAFYRFVSLPTGLCVCVCACIVKTNKTKNRADGPRGFRAVSMKELPVSLAWNGESSNLVASKKIGQSG